MNDADLEDDSWRSIEQDIVAGDHPDRADLASALRRGEPVPTRCQNYLADLLAGVLDRRGRPRKAAGHGGFSRYSKYFVEHAAETQGVSIGHILEQMHVADGRSITLESYKKNYYQSISDDDRSDNGIFHAVGNITNSMVESGRREPVSDAIEELSEKLGLAVEDVQRAYRRGRNVYKMKLLGQF